jgi:hypothetical protein
MIFLAKKDRWCSACGHLLNAATSVTEEGAMPKAGDASVCSYCSTILIFTSDDGATRLATAAEVAEVLADFPELPAAIDEFGQAMGAGKKPSN